MTTQVYTYMADLLKKVNEITTELEELKSTTENDDIHDLCIAVMNGLDVVGGYMDDINDEVSSMEYELEEAINEKDWAEERISNLEYEAEQLREELYYYEEESSSNQVGELQERVRYLEHQLSLSIQF